jgi:haloacetate dehalogenase
VTIDGFTPREIVTGETNIFACVSGTGPPLLLLHGFPQTHVMWRRVAPLLENTFTIVTPNLRGYGRSGCTSSDSPLRGRELERAAATSHGFP